MANASHLPTTESIHRAGVPTPARQAGIILNLLVHGGYADVAMRDFGLMVGALALGRLSDEYDRHDL